MNFQEKQISPPKNWELFERLCHAIFRDLWGDPLAEMNGRRGQAQHGVDIYSSPQSNTEGRQAVQCKGKDGHYGHSVTLSELEQEISKAENFQPYLTHWILVTTAPRDAALQAEVRRISDLRKTAGLFTVQVLAWEDLQGLIANARQVIEEFYPEHAFNLKGLIEGIRSSPFTKSPSNQNSLLHADTIPPIGSSNWSEISFSSSRDLGRALLGQSLGAADAVTCPRLNEADLALKHLEVGYSARLVGSPGAGKSVAAYQVAHSLAKNGWRIVRAEDPQLSHLPLPFDLTEQKTLIVLDDAHLMEPATLRRFEDSASQELRILSTQNVVEGSAQPIGAISLDSRKAVETIARKLIERREETLTAVRRADSTVGDLRMETELEERIQAAANKSETPWQFCFILGGGWRRAAESAANAKAANADLALALIAARQIGTRDARATYTDIQKLCVLSGLGEAEIEHAIDWLVKNRLVISERDLRSPHQLFAIRVFENIVENQDDVQQQKIVSGCRSLLVDNSSSLGGSMVLLTELGRLDCFRWRKLTLLDEGALDAIKSRVWSVDRPEDISYAAGILTALESFDESWPSSFLDLHLGRLGSWLSRPSDPSGIGLGGLVNNVWNKDKGLARKLIATCDPHAFADIVSIATPNDVFTVATLLDRLCLGVTDDWKSKFWDSLNKGHHLEMAASWPSDKAWSLLEFVRAVDSINHEYALDLLEAAAPILSSRFDKIPFEAFSEFRDVLWFVLKVWMPLGPASNLAKKSSRETKIANAILATINTRVLADRFSKAKRRDLENLAAILTVLKHTNISKFKSTVTAIDWVKIEATIGEGWRDLDHGDLIAICVGAGVKAARSKINTILLRRAIDMDIVDTRIVLLAPDAAVLAFENGAKINIGYCMTFEWILAAAAIHELHKISPTVALDTARANLSSMISGFERDQANTYTDVDIFIEALSECAPEVLAESLDNLSVAKAEVAWANCLRSGGKPRRAAIALIAAAEERPGDSTKMAQRLRRKFPKASMSMVAKTR